MKTKLMILLCALFASFSLYAEDDLAQLDHLIAVTKQNLKSQTDLKDKLKVYLDLQNQYLKNPEDKELLLRAARAASKALDTIQEAHLTSAFSQPFMTELTLFAQIAQKRGIPKP